MRLIVGLGNPGKKYEGNRHNVGFMAVESILRRHSFAGPVEKFHGLFWHGTLADEKVYILLPQTNMNGSGRAVQAVMAFYKIKPEEIVVLHDEIDLKPGQVRTKQGGGSAGQNGINSIDAAIGNNYWRVRIGVGHPRDIDSPMQVADYVLSNFSAEEKPLFTQICDVIGEYAPVLVGSNIRDIENKVAMRVQAMQAKLG